MSSMASKNLAGSGFKWNAGNKMLAPAFAPNGTIEDKENNKSQDEGI